MMDGISWMVFLLGPIGILALVIIFIYLIARRMEIKKQEDFEDRDN